MANTGLANEIRTRINELRSEQLHLRTFIESDVARREALEKAIEELNWVLELVTAGKDESA